MQHRRSDLPLRYQRALRAGAPGTQSRRPGLGSRNPNISISTITIDEVIFGLTLRSNVRVLAWFEDFLTSSCQVLDVTPAVARLAGAMRARLAGRGQVRTQADMLIAASAAAHGLTLVTRNTKDFTGCGISVLNPFRGKG